MSQIIFCKVTYNSQIYLSKYFNILRYGSAYYRNIAIAFLFLMIYTVFSAVSLMSVIPFLEILFQADNQATTPPVMQSAWDISMWKAQGYYLLHEWIRTSPSKFHVLLSYCGVLMLAILLKNFGRYMSVYYIAPLEHSIVKELRTHIFSHLTKLGLPFYTSRKKGDIIGLMVSDVQVVQEAVIGTVMNLLREPLTMLTFLLAMMFISWKMTLFTLIVLPLTGFFLNLISKTLKRKAVLSQEALGELTAILEEFITAIRVVKSFQKEDFEAKRYEQQNDIYNVQQIAYRRRVELASPVTEILSVLIVCVILLYAGSMILAGNGELKANEFIGFIALFSQFMLPIKNISTGISKINKAIVSYQRIEDLLAVAPVIVNAKDAISFSHFEKEIRFEQVSFQYKTEKVLKNISFSIQKGQTVAIVGPSGGGKSTLVDLIPRFYDTVSGKITLDGIDIKQINLFDLRQQIGYVTQESVLFHDSILHNIAYGIENPDKNAVKAAAEIANAAEFIEKLPQKYDTRIGERGMMLSGGQRQRIAIARAVLRNPPVLILDEATSNLDTESEKWVQDALDKLMQNRTSIVIAHRLSTILKADKIVVIDKGEIVEEGTHLLLLAKNGVYKRLYEMQFA